MAVPKKQKSKAKTRSRRAQHDKTTEPTIDMCPECHAPKRPHRACLECGFYQTQSMDEPEQIVEVWEI